MDSPPPPLSSFKPVYGTDPYTSCSVFSFQTTIGTIFPILIDRVQDALKTDAVLIDVASRVVERVVGNTDRSSSAQLIPLTEVSNERMTVFVVQGVTADGIQTIQQLCIDHAISSGDFFNEGSTTTADMGTYVVDNMYNFVNNDDVQFNVSINFSSTHVEYHVEWVGNNADCRAVYNKIGEIVDNLCSSKP